ncbi:MAG: carbon storage regulator CsrA [Planctomycetota bacterium]|jgi:carbon storage regulator
MLVLSRRKNESIMVGENVEVTIIGVRSNEVRLGITAPRYIEVHRKEVYEAIHCNKTKKAQFSRSTEELVKIAVASTGPTLEDYVGTWNGHNGYLLIIDPDTMQYEVLQNPLAALHGPAAGRAFSQLLLQEGVHTILAGNCGTNMPKVLGDTDISIVVGMTGSVRDTVEQFKDSYCSCSRWTRSSVVGST